jgi:hypothetical protein
LKNQIKNIEGRSTSSEEALEYFGAKGALSLKNENIMCDNITKIICISHQGFTIKRGSSLFDGDDIASLGPQGTG